MCPLANAFVIFIEVVLLIYQVIASHCSLVLCAEKRKEMEEWISAFKIAACSIAKTHVSFKSY